MFAVFVISGLVVFLFQTLLPVEFRVNESSDYLSFYEPVARRILDGDGMVHADGTPAMIYPPGYSLVLAFVLRLFIL